MKINLAMTTPKDILCPGCLITLNQQNICFYEGVALCGCCLGAAVFDCRANVRQTIEEKTDVKHLTCHRGLLLYTPHETPRDPPHLLDATNFDATQSHKTHRLMQAKKKVYVPTGDPGSTTSTP